MQKIKLTRNKYALVDDEDYKELNSFKWVCTNTNYAARGKIKRVYMHRLLLNDPKGLEVDHINGERLDNRKENLRVATRAQNSINSSKYNQVCSSIYKGVCWNKKDKCWRSRIQGKHIGLFGTEIEAAIAYDKKAKEIYGNFARLNFN